MVKKYLLWIYRATLLSLWLVIIVLALSVLAMRYLILPNIDGYKDQIAAKASAAIGQQVSIGNITASWDGLNPHLSLLDVGLRDNQGRQALAFDHVEASLSWLSIPLMEPRLSRLVIYQPELTIRREPNGTIYVAGIAMGGQGRPDFANWILRQSEVDVINASLVWQDDLRKAPPLALSQLRMKLVTPVWKGFIGHHQFGLRALPSAGSAYPIDVRGNFYGKDISHPEDWRGTLYARVESTDISAWRNWIKYPFDLREGYGATRFWMDIAEGEPQSVVSDVILTQVKTRLAKTTAETRFDSLSGRLSWLKHTDGQEFRAEQLRLDTPYGLNTKNGAIIVRKRLVNGKEWTEGRITLDEIWLEALAGFAGYLPLPDKARKMLAGFAPVGKLKNLSLTWKGDQPIPQEYSFSSTFSGLGIKPYEHIPGLSNLSGSIDANEEKGSLSLDSRAAAIEPENIMRWPIPAERLSGEIRWDIGKMKTDITVKNLAIANPHLTGTINADYSMSGLKSGQLDLTAKFSRADLKFAPYYYPALLGEKTIKWLDQSILSGRASDVNVRVKGHLNDFPFPNNKQGLFKVTAKVDNGAIDFAAGWPKIENIKLDMLFEGTRMELNATGGNIQGTRINKAKISIPQLNADQPVLDVVAQGSGTISEGIRFINSSPVADVTEGFTKNLETSGNGTLNLELHIPLHDTSLTKIKGSYAITDGSATSPSLPPLSRINGKLDFTESSLRGQNVTAWLYGGPAVFNLVTAKDHSVNVGARGKVNAAGLRQIFGPGLADHISGSADWIGEMHVINKQLHLIVDSSLVGMSASLPPPLTKSAADALPLRFELRQNSPTQELITASLGELLSAKIQRNVQNGSMTIDRGEIGLNTVAELPAQAGLSIRGNLDRLDVDEWRNLMDKNATANVNGGGMGGTDGLHIAKVDMSVNILDVFDKRLNRLKLSAKPVTEDSWQMNVQSQEITGDVLWIGQGNGKVVARLKTLIPPNTTPGTAELRPQGRFQQQAQEYPALDIEADEFEIGKKKLGRLELLASEQNDDWSIEKLRIITPESTLNVEGKWHNWKRRPNTRINITWDIRDLGKTLDRFGYPATVRGGSASMRGQLKWPGSPHEFNPGGLSGNLQLNARHGQILKIKPGVGRLFSVLSLQNLPRRLAFDFRDVFSSGFTFDKISSSVRIDKGIMQSDDFRMEGPTAKVEIKGQTDLQKETQHLFVKVTPYISDSLSIAALAGGPVVGAAAFVAQKLLKDPINKLAANEYEIAGTWENPQEVRSGEPTPSTAPATPPLGR